MTPKEQHLRARFAELKKHDERIAPDFQKMWAARRPALSPWRVVVPVASLAAAAMLVMWCGATTFMLDAPQSAAPVAVTSHAVLEPAPLDFLLDAPASASLSRSSGLDSNPLKGW